MAGTQWTNEQKQAIETRRCNLLVAAAAGSGKTAVLVERIIRIITDEKNPVDIDRLLVVTFTSAAAAEMRERIAAAISKELEKNPNSKLLQRQLTLLSRSNITTMHSFCLDVIKNYYHTIDLDPSFRISDETEGVLLRNQIIDDLFEEYYDNDDEEFKRLVEAYSTSRDDKKLKEIILNLYRFSMSGAWPEKWLVDKAEDFNIGSLEELNNTNWVDILRDSIAIETDGYLTTLENAIEIIMETEGLEPYLDTFKADRENLIQLRESANASIQQIYHSINLIEFEKLKTVRKNKVSDVDAQDRVKLIRDNTKKKIKKLKEDTFSMTPDEMLEGIQLSYPYMKKLSEITLKFMELFSEKKREKNILDFNDLEHLCLKILIEKDGDNIQPSKVADDFREFFDEVLVDEYQDSNNVQETIIDLVSRKSLDNPNVFMVGDVKQSIYRFRQAKPELFLDKYNRYPLAEGERNRKIQLYKNFRSRDEVISGVNFIFKQAMSKTVGELEYTDEEALNLGASYKEIDEANTIIAGPIELHIFDKSQEIEEDIDEDEDVDSITLEARIVSSRIRDLMNPPDGKVFKVFDKDAGGYRPIKYKDIVILLRATKNWSDIFLEELGLDGIPVYADTGSGYFESIEIRTIMSLLKIIDNPMQDVPIISVLRSPIAGFTSEELTDLRLLVKDEYFYTIITKIINNEFNVNDELKEKCTIFIKNIEKWRRKAIYTPIDEFIWYLYMDTAYYGYVGAMPNGKLRQANLRILFQRAKQYEETSFKGLFNFINFINLLRKSSGDMGSAKILGENEDVVRIMSIHKSKGLEFPVVFTSGTGKQFNLMDLTNNILYHEELGFGPEYVDIERRNAYSTLAKEAIKKRMRMETLSEEMRILYVAFTRAKEKLIITGATSDFEKSAKMWASAAALKSENILPSEVMKGKSYLDWIGMSLCNHSCGQWIREFASVENNSISKDLSTWIIKKWDKNQLIVDKSEIAVDIDEDKETVMNAKVRTIDEEIKRRLGYTYKYSESKNLPSNISVSDLKKSEYDDEDILTVKVFEEKEVLKPKFLKEEKGLSAAEKGTIMHFVMQKLNLDFVNSKEEVDNQIADMIKKDLLTEQETKTIRTYKILRFFRSNLGKRMLEAYRSNKKVVREMPFFTEISSLELDNTLSHKVYGDETIRLQGIIDCFFEEDDYIVLLDYKTDYIEEGKEEEFLEKYKLQIKYYKNAIEKITNKEVKETYLYSFFKDEEMTI